MEINLWQNIGIAGTKNYIKTGVVKGKQCKHTISENEQRYKYSLSKRLKVLKGYLE